MFTYVAGLNSNPPHLLQQINSKPSHLLQHINSNPSHLLQQIKSNPSHLLQQIGNVEHKLNKSTLIHHTSYNKSVMLNTS